MIPTSLLIPTGRRKLGPLTPTAQKNPSGDRPWLHESGCVHWARVRILLPEK